MEITNVRDIGRLIRSQRRTLGWSQTRLAEEVRTTRRWVSEIEHGKPTAEIGLVLATLLALGIRVDIDLPAAADQGPGPTHGPAPRPSADELGEVLSRYVEPGATRPQRLTFGRAER